MIEINIPSPNLKRIVEKTLAIVNDTYALTNTEKQLARVIKRLEGEFGNKMVTTVWYDADFMSDLEDLGLSDEQQEVIASRAMLRAEKDFDCNNGLTWDSIQYYVLDEKIKVEQEEADKALDHLRNKTHRQNK